MPTSPPSLQPPAASQSFSFGGYLGTPAGIEGVGFWPRFAARLIDICVHVCASFMAGIVLAIGLAVYAGASGQAFPPLIDKLQKTGIWNYVFALLGSVAYHVMCESVHGSTVGKLLLSMVVVQEDGSPCRFGSAVIRSFAYFVDGLFFGLVGYFAMQKTPQQQRYGDQWAHTIVCKRSRVTQQNLRGGGRFALALLLGIMADGAMALVAAVINVSS